MNLEDQREKYLETCRNVIHREGLEDLLNWLQKSDFFYAPASTHFHGAYSGGLCEHSLDVYYYAQTLSFLSPQPVSEESLAIAALFHDICKCNIYKVENRNKKIDGVWHEVPFYTVDERLHFGGHGSKSVYQVQYFMKLTPEEATAINCHMGFSDGNPSTIREVSKAYEQFPLAWIIHVADEAATYLLER